MVYIETTDKEKSILKSLCDIEEIEDIGIRSSLYERMNDNGRYFNMFITDFKETEVDIEKEIYKWTYDVVYVPLKNVSRICSLLNLEEGTILKKKF